MNNDYIEDFLMHHGVKGQKWGVRRYQNEDGTLTKEGKEQYSKLIDESKQKCDKIISKLNKNEKINDLIKLRNDIDEKYKVAKPVIDQLNTNYLDYVDEFEQKYGKYEMDSGEQLYVIEKAEVKWYEDAGKAFKDFVKNDDNNIKLLIDYENKCLEYESKFNNLDDLNNQKTLSDYVSYITSNFTNDKNRDFFPPHFASPEYFERIKAKDLSKMSDKYLGEYLLHFYDFYTEDTREELKKRYY